MKNLLLAAMLIAPVAARAQVAKVRATCVCDRGDFKPLTEKARAVEEYWHARRKVKVSEVVSGTGLLFGLLARSPEIVGDASRAHEEALSEMRSARAKAERLGALKVTGDELDGTVEIKLERGVDYSLTP